MKKFLSKVLTLALVCAIVVTGTSFTSEAKPKKQPKSTPAKVFIDTVLASDGLTVNGQKLTTNQIAAKLKTNDPSLKVVSGYVDGVYYQEDIYNDNPFAGVEDQLQLMRYGSISIVRSDANPEIYTLDTSVYSANLDNAGNCNPMAIIWSNTKGYNTAELAANNVNASTLATYMQSNNMVSAIDIYNYLVANGVKFTEDSWNTYSNGDQSQVGVIATVNGYNIRFQTAIQTAYADDGEITNARQAKVTNTTISIQNAKTYEWLGSVHTDTDVDGKVTTYLSKI